MGTLTALTVEEFMASPRDPDSRYELSEGELIVVGTAVAKHEIAKFRVMRVLFAYILRNPIGVVFSETSFILGPRTFRMPDVSFATNEKLANYNPDKMFTFAPDLAIEIVSAHDEAENLETRIEQFLNAGSQAVCLVYMQPRKVYLHEPSGVRVFKESDLLEIPAVLPGFSVPVAELFN